MRSLSAISQHHGKKAWLVLICETHIKNHKIGGMQIEIVCEKSGRPLKRTNHRQTKRSKSERGR